MPFQVLYSSVWERGMEHRKPVQSASRTTSLERRSGFSLAVMVISCSDSQLSLSPCNNLWLPGHIWVGHCILYSHPATYDLVFFWEIWYQWLIRTVLAYYCHLPLVYLFVPSLSSHLLIWACKVLRCVHVGLCRVSSWLYRSVVDHAETLLSSMQERCTNEMQWTYCHGDHAIIGSSWKSVQ